MKPTETARVDAIAFVRQAIAENPGVRSHIVEIEEGLSEALALNAIDDEELLAAMRRVLVDFRKVLEQ